MSNNEQTVRVECAVSLKNLSVNKDGNVVIKSAKLAEAVSEALKADAAGATPKGLGLGCDC